MKILKSIQLTCTEHCKIIGFKIDELEYNTG